MELIKETIVTMPTTDGKVLATGMKVVFNTTDGRCSCGIFEGFNNRGNLIIKSLIDNSTTTIMPKSIKNLFIANIDILED